MATNSNGAFASDRLSVLIAGAGVGGLMTALECQRFGFDVRILEKAPEHSSLGDSFNICPSGLTTMKLYPGLEKKRNEIGYDPLFSFHGPTGTLLRGPVEGIFVHSGGVARAPEHQIYRYKRPAFAAMLIAQVEKCGMQIEYGKDVVDYFDDADGGQAGVVLKDGTRLLADVVVAADGRRSRSWALVEGKPTPARSSGQALYRCTIPIETALADPLVAERFPLQDGREMLQWWSCDGFQLVVTRLKDSIEYVINHPDSGTAEESWSSKVPVEELLKLTNTVPDWPEAANRLFQMSPGGKVVDWKLMWRDVKETWVSPNGRVVQLGDAAHAYLPSSGNGATQALEDAVSLAQCLALAPAGKGRVSDATRVHNLLRFERTSYLMAHGVANQFVRDQDASKKEGKLLYAGFGLWIIGHDPGQYARDNFEAALGHIKEGKPFENTNTPAGAVYRPWTFDSLREALAKDEPSIMNGNWD